MTIDDASVPISTRPRAAARSCWPGSPSRPRQDDILALIVARHEPSRLLWRAAVLDRARPTESADEVCDEIARSTDVRMPPPPGR